MPETRTRRAYRRRALDAWVAGAGLIVFLLAAVVAHSGRVGPAERSLFRGVNGLPDWLSGPMTALQFLGTLLVGPLVVVAALAFRRWRMAGAAAAATLLKLGSERVVKAVVHRQRPGLTDPGAILRGNVPPRGWAFVSGHLILTGALAMIIAPYLRGRWRSFPGSWSPWWEWPASIWAPTIPSTWWEAWASASRSEASSISRSASPTRRRLEGLSGT